MKTGYVAMGAIGLVLTVPLLIYSLNGLTQFDTSFGQLARSYSAEGQQKYNEWQMLELLSVVFVACSIISLAYGMVAKNEVRHNDHHQFPGRVF